MNGLIPLHARLTQEPNFIVRNLHVTQNIDTEALAQLVLWLLVL